MKNLLSFSIITVLAIAFNTGCKQDSVSTGGLNSSAPVHKIQPPAPAIGTTAANVAAKAQNHRAAKAQDVSEYKVHLIDVLYIDPNGDPILTFIDCKRSYDYLNADLDVTVDPSGEWHMTVSNFKVINFNNTDGNSLRGDYGGFVSGFGGNGTWNDAFNAAVGDIQEPTGAFYGYQGALYVGSGKWLDNGGHYQEGQKDRVSLTLTDLWNSGNHFTVELHFTRSDSGEFTCEASMCN